MKFGKTRKKPIHKSAVVVALPTSDDAIFSLVGASKYPAHDMVEGRGIVGVPTLARFHANNRLTTPMADQSALLNQPFEQARSLRD